MASGFLSAIAFVFVLLLSGCVQFNNDVQYNCSNMVGRQIPISPPNIALWTDDYTVELVDCWSGTTAFPTINIGNEVGENKNLYYLHGGFAVSKSYQNSSSNGVITASGTYRYVVTKLVLQPTGQDRTGMLYGTIVDIECKKPSQKYSSGTVGYSMCQYYYSN
jgi:hypothetical protein